MQEQEKITQSKNAGVMNIREAKPSDLPGIISVLKASLGESKLQKSVKIWNFKHVENPFGASLVLVATEADIIVGVRAFMRWQWQWGHRVFSAFRAVDTATHPNFQGKGIFKKLTLKAIEIAKENGDHFIFNTPNSQSLPGYLKMDWKKVEKLKVQLVPVNPAHWNFKNKEPDYLIEKDLYETGFEQVLKNYNTRQAGLNKLFTPKSDRYLNWRYENNPLQEYQVYKDSGVYLAGYIKQHAYFKELRIVEHLYDTLEDRKRLKKRVKIWSRKFGAQVISLGGSDPEIFSFKISGNYGPVLTFRNLTLEEDIQQNLLNIKNWSYPLGDLELF